MASKRTPAVHPREARKTACRILFSLGLLGLSAFEVVHDLVLRATWPGHLPAIDNVVFIHVPLWLVASAAIWVRRDVAWFGIIPGLLSCLIHGVAARIGGSAWGPMFMAAAPLLLVLAWQGRRPRPADRLGDAPRQPRALQAAGRGAEAPR